MSKLLLILATLVILPASVLAQELSDGAPSANGADSGLGEEMESLFSDQQKQVEQAEERAEEQQQPRVEKPEQLQVKELSDLAKLAPFADVAMIQKRYLPRTGRFEAYIAANTILNDAFFTSVGADGRLAYYFTEKYGVEFTAMKLISSDRRTTKDLREKLFIATTSFVMPETYFGLDFKWSPVYGKMTFRNKKIVHFDMYFSAGGGSTSHSQGSSPTIHLGTGQNFALSKSMTFRWDFSLNMYSATSTVGSSKGSSSYQNLFLGAGVSWFFPEASYR